MDNETDDWWKEPVAMEIDGVLDLHAFHPRDVQAVVSDYLDECRRKGILELRIIHGKGTGVQREIVHRVLGRTPFVRNYRLGGHEGGGWGATLVTLFPLKDY